MSARPPYRTLTAFALVAAAPLGTATALPAQDARIPLFDAAEEAALARSAAEPAISADADVWVLTADGYRLHARGTNGWSCIVERDHPESLAPICYDPEGTRALVPGVRRVEELRRAGIGYRAAVDSVEALYRSGALPEPARPVLSYMLSPGQRLYASPEGPAIGAWKPHVMIFHPSFSEQALALPRDGSAMVSHLGRVFNYLILPVGAFPSR